MPSTDAPIKENPRTVLFVDDERNILSALNRLFRPLGYRIFTAESGKAALEILERETIDLVVSDMRMPEMDGAQLLAKIAAQWPDTLRMLLTGYADIHSTVSAINNGHIYRYISKPWDDNDIKLNIKSALQQKTLIEEKAHLEELTQQQNIELQQLNHKLESKVMERTRQLQEANVSLVRSYKAAVQVFSGLVELREGLSKGHAKRVAEHCKQFATSLGMDDAAVQTLFYSALLHDIGILGLDDGILKKPFEALNLNERNEYIKHPLIGAALLMEMAPLHDVVPIIKAHHEHWDGTGYPEGLKEENIPIGARILSIVSDYDSLQLGLLTKQPMTKVQARAFIEKHKRRRYDPKLVDLFLALPEPIDTSGLGQNLSILQLQEGMVLTRDLTHDGMLLLAKGAVISARMISTLAKLERAIGSPISVQIETIK